MRGKYKPLDRFLKTDVKEKESDVDNEETKGLYQIPSGWRWLKLKDILIEDRKTIDPQKYPDKRFFLVTMDCIESNTGLLVKKIFRYGKEIKSIKYRFNEKHILYGKLRPYLNKVYIPHREGICTTEFIPFKVSGAIREYVAYYLRRKEVVSYAMRNVTGTRQPRVILQKFLEYPIPIPPIEEQRRIVSCLEEILGKIREAEQLKREVIEDTEKIMESAVYKVFSKADEKGWKRVKLGDVLVKKPQYGLTAKASKDRKEIRYIRITDITDWGELKEDDPRYIDINATEFEKYRLEENDILIARSGSVGRVYLHKPIDQKAVFASYLIRFKLDCRKILPEFFFYYSLSPDYKRFIEDSLRVVAQPNINARKYCELEIPLPPIDEQKQIVKYLNKVKGHTKSIRTINEEMIKQIKKLSDAVLDKAFKGQL